MSFEFLGKKRKLVVKFLGKNPDGSFEVELNGRHRQVTVLRSLPDESIDILVGHKAYNVRVIDDSPSEMTLSVNGKRTKLLRAEGKKRGQLVHAQGVQPKTKQVSENSVVSAVPGKVVRVLVEPGMNVRKGDTIAVIESMKMEASVRSHRDGKILEVRVREGNGVQPGTLIALLE
jgi:biotin carboxyl carrier protein